MYIFLPFYFYIIFALQRYNFFFTYTHKNADKNIISKIDNLDLHICNICCTFAKNIDL